MNLQFAVLPHLKRVSEHIKMIESLTSKGGLKLKNKAFRATIV